MLQNTILTDVIILMPNVELIAEREGAVALKLFRELDRCMRGMGAVALPAFEAQLRVTRTVTTITDHVEHVLLSDTSLAAVVVRTVDIQIVIDIHLHSVALLTKSDDTEKHSQLLLKTCWTYLAFLSIYTYIHQAMQKKQKNPKNRIVQIYINDLRKVYMCGAVTSHQSFNRVPTHFQPLFQTHISKTLSVNLSDHN